MTTLELARLVAEAARDASAADAAVAVLQVLRVHDVWFCRVMADEAGVDVDVPMPPVRRRRPTPQELPFD